MPDVTPPGSRKVLVDAEALFQVLRALCGPEHHIRELQATRSLHGEGLATNPIEVLIDDFAAWHKQQQSDEEKVVLTTVWKYPVHVGTNMLSVPVGGEFIHAAIDPSGTPCVWYRFHEDKQNIRQNRILNVTGTGHNVPATREYIGTYQQDMFVWHVFAVEV